MSITSMQFDIFNMECEKLLNRGMLFFNFLIVLQPASNFTCKTPIKSFLWANYTGT